MHNRIKSTGPLKYPSPKQHIVKKRQQLKEYNCSRLSKQSKATKVTTVTMSPQLTSQSRIMLTNTSQRHHRFHSSFGILDKDPLNRPATTSPLKCRDRLSSPLSVINNLSQHFSDDEYECSTNLSPPLRNNFLRKRASVDKMIIKNILKSKLSMNIYSSTVSYSDAPQNKDIIKMVQKHIPRGLRDIVGAEQMLRMTHLVTGIQFKTIKTQQTIKKALQERKTAYYLKNHVEDDDIILRSIQRW